MSGDPGDTIAAIATPPGRGGIGVIRISGPAVAAIMPRLLGRVLPPRRACYGPFLDEDGAALDRGLALFFPAPHSYTGEAVLELHGHGSPVLLDLLLQRILGLGARLARPGEFTERAFLNERIDLAQAEAVADLIGSATAAAARAAGRSLQGDFSRRIEALVECLIELRLQVEAAIDFSDEDIELLSRAGVGERLADLRRQLQVLRASAHQGQLLRDGMTVVIAGLPNAGKSSLLNRLAGRDAAIVTDLPGTTRDVLRESIQIDGLPLHIVDTAGLRDGTDAVEREGIRRARLEIAKADRVLLLIDDRDPAAGEALLPTFPAGAAITRIYNKIDLTGTTPGYRETAGGPCLYLSLQTGAGYAELLRHLKTSVGYASDAEGVCSARRRHLDALEAAATALDRATSHLDATVLELLAEDLREAQTRLGEITGVFTSDELLGRIFADFCIGK